MNNLGQLKLGKSGSLKGRDYVLMINKYLGAINCGQMPDLLDTWTYIRNERGRAAV